MIFDTIAELIRLIWQADSDMRDGSRVGQSALDRRSRKFVAWICGIAIVVILSASLLFWWFVEWGYG